LLKPKNTWFENPPVDTTLSECVPEWALVVSIVAEPPLWAVTMTLHTLLFKVLSKSVPMIPVDGLEPDGGDVPVVVVVAGGVVVVAGGVLVVTGGVVVVAVAVVVTCKH